jgi:SAM-dependent methyltransferase
MKEGAVPTTAIDQRPRRRHDHSKPAAAELYSFDEDLLSMTLRSAELAQIWCNGCASYHGTRTARRLIDLSGLDSDRPILTPLFHDLARSRPEARWLVAGSADAGLFAMLASAIWPVAPSSRLVIVDRCPTPLELCEEYGSRYFSNFRTLCADLVQFSSFDSFDFIFTHSLLEHMDEVKRLAVLANWHALLRPDGRIIASFKLNSALATPITACGSGEVVDQMVRELQLKGIGDPHTLSLFNNWFLAEMVDKPRRRGIFNSPRELIELFTERGFASVTIEHEYRVPKRAVFPSGQKERRVLLLAGVRQR